MRFSGLDELALYRSALARVREENRVLRDRVLGLAVEVRGWGHNENICSPRNKCLFCVTAEKLEALVT